MPITQDNALSILLLLEDWHRAQMQKSTISDKANMDDDLPLCLAAAQKLVEYIKFNFMESDTALSATSSYCRKGLDVEVHAVSFRKSEDDAAEFGLSFGNIPIFGDPDIRKKGCSRKKREEGPIINVGCIWVTEVKKKSPAACCRCIKLRDELLSVNGQLMVGVNVSGASYLVDQCWNGGCIYLILLRRIKRKAPLPPCVKGSFTIPNKMDHCQTQQDITDFEVVNCKRTRKLGVISQSSNQGYSDEEVSSSLEDCCPDLSPQTRTIHSYNGSAGTLPGRSHSQVLECKMQSFTSEATTQMDWSNCGSKCTKICTNLSNMKKKEGFGNNLREGSHIWKMHMVKGHEGLGIQITGGRGSKRSSHGIIITHIEKGGAIHR
uniref:PDZ domain-containing protein n=1 Tax=Poecilia formosa TaxID=48698 RepID=A0A087Y249_POEFO